MDIRELLALGENTEIEFKRGLGGFPADALETLSAFANTKGGTIVFGVMSKNNETVHEIDGIRNPSSFLKAMWDSLNNTQRINFPCIRDENVFQMEIDGKQVIYITTYPVDRRLRPIFTGKNPFGGTYKRNHSGDYVCSDAEVRQMLRDASEDPQDLIVFDGTSENDIDQKAISAFRSIVTSRTPNSLYIQEDNIGLLTRLGGWRQDPINNVEGLTLAGIVMFGKERSILNALPNYFVDYQELSSGDPEIRWTDRITMDGTWEPNLFNFYRRVYPELVRGLRTPFQLDDDAVRKEDTPVKHALREALVNTLTHADYRAKGSIRISMRKDAYLFQNPGRSLLPVPMILEAVRKQRLDSIPRNPNLQMMFRALGWAERSGTGYPKIFRAWRGQQRLDPLIVDDTEKITVTLPLLSLVPRMVERELRGIVGTQYARLKELDKLILLMAHQFGEISHPTIQDSSSEHPKIITERLTYLAREGWISRHGTSGRGRTYRLGVPKEPDLVDAMGRDSAHSKENFDDNALTSTHSDDQSHAEDLIALVRSSGRAMPQQTENAILSLCQNGFVSLADLSVQLNRSVKTLRPHINRLVSNKKLSLKIPSVPNSPKQAYRALNQ